MSSIVFPCYSPSYSHFPPRFLRSSACWWCFLTVLPYFILCFSLISHISHVIPQISSLISCFLSDLPVFIPDFSIVFSLFPMLSSLWSRFPLWSSCLSHVSSLLSLMMIVIKSIWWCPPLLSSACWWCFLSVLSLRSDYRGWLLIIFISNILLWWPLFLSF